MSRTGASGSGLVPAARAALSDYLTHRPRENGDDKLETRDHSGRPAFANPVSSRS